MNEGLALDQALCRGTGSWAVRLNPLERLDAFCICASCGSVEKLAIERVDVAVGHVAEIRGLFEHCVEYRREIAGRGIDDSEHLRGRGLLFERFARFRDQPRILYRDDRLRREVLQ